MSRRRWTVLALAGLALDLAIIVLFHRTGHSRRVQWMSIATVVILLVTVPSITLTLLLGRSFRTRPQRRWWCVSQGLLVLASGAVALAYRYRLEHPNGQTILYAAASFAVIAGGDLAGLVLNRRTSEALRAFGFVSIGATTIAVILALTWNPCRYKYCVDVGMDARFGEWLALAAALTITSAWVAYCAARPVHRARWGLRFVGLVLTIYLGAFGALAQASRIELGPFYCGPPIVPYDAPAPPSSDSSC